DSLDLGSLAGHLKEVVTERLASIIDVNHEEFDGTYIQATALNPQLAVLLTEQQLSYARSAIEQELHSRQPAPTSSLTMDALLASVLSSSPDSLPLYTDLLQQAQRLQQERNAQPMRDRITEAALSSYFDELLSGSTAEALLSPLRSFGNPLQTPLVFWQGCMQTMSNVGQSGPRTSLHSYSHGDRRVTFGLTWCITIPETGSDSNSLASRQTGKTRSKFIT
ncbi:hypothetical protein OSTOST_25487, partial [Ostertagia ostertagi]